MWISIHAALILLSLASLTSAEGKTYCDDLESSFQSSTTTNRTLRRVDPISGEDTWECLNSNNTGGPEPCLTLGYALHGTGDISGEGPVRSDLVIELSAGVYRAVNDSTSIINSNNVAIVGAGVAKTIMVCGTNGSRDVPCEYTDFEIRNSSNISITGVTFTGCGPITSSFHISHSDFISIDKCSFENNISPSLLINIVPNIIITNSSFLNNTPADLSPEVVHNRCYYSRIDKNTFYLDNRTTSGGISMYQSGTPANIMIQDCLFFNNSARNDNDTGLVRRSEGYGQGGAMNIRLKQSQESTICIRRNKFTRNSAEAHAGALAFSLAGSSGNRFVVLDSTFDHNRCLIDQCTGGAVGISFYSDTVANTFLFQNSNFTSNSAASSGAIVFSTSVSANMNDEGSTDLLRLNNCWFVENEAFFEGTALGVFSLTHSNEVGIPVDVEDCHFVRNQGSRGSGDTTAVTVYRVQITFYGDNTFDFNNGGGATLLTSRMDVKGNLTFNGNRAVFGAGVAMAGRSLLLLSENSHLLFSNNFAEELGAGLYVEFKESDFVLSILNTGCFIRYNDPASADLPPNQWKARITFLNNTAVVAGAAIYANDMSRCRWLGGLPGDHTIFEIGEGSPFTFMNNNVTETDVRGNISNQMLATNPSTISAKLDVNSNLVSYGETVSFYLNSGDQLGNYREAVWSVEAPDISQRLGSLSSNATVYNYNVPSKSALINIDEVDYINDTARFKVTFLLQNGVQSSTLELVIKGCHPGYRFDQESQSCVCDQIGGIVRCDLTGRYFYVQDGLWVGIDNETGDAYFSSTIPGFLSCSQLGTLPGCLFKFDDRDEQCASGREGILCGDCRSDYGVTFDLRFCRDNCGSYGILLFIAICIITPVLSLAVLYYDFPIPNQLKGVIFYAQVIGVIYRSTPFLTNSSMFFDILINLFGFAMPFPICIHEKLPVVAMAFLGYIPPALAMITAIFYSLCANKIKMLSHRENYGFHGFYFLLLFVFKYIMDTSFLFISCSGVNGESHFLYQGSQRCSDFPFILVVFFGLIVILLVGVCLPLYVLKLIYFPKKFIQVRSSLSHGLKDGRRYLWYGVWEIWRRLLFVGAQLFIQITTQSVVLFIHSLLVLLCLCVLCIVKPYKKYYINLIEGSMILCLFATTLSVFDRDNDLYVGKTTAIVTILLPFGYGLLFIVYRVARIIIRNIWPRLKKQFDMDDKLLPAKEMVSDIINKVKEKTQGLVGEDEGIQLYKGRFLRKASLPLEELKIASDRESGGVEQSYSPYLRETLLDDDSR